MTIYYQTSSWASQPKVTEKEIKAWEHASTKSNWRIVQLPNGFYQTEIKSEAGDWRDITRRETIEGAETAINGSVKHFADKLEATKGPKVVKTFE